jgi:chlorobactene glucosyltransferase
VELTLSIVWFAIVAWLIARAVGQRGLLKCLEPIVAPRPDGDAIAVIVPARDEEINIANCLQRLIQQTYPAAQTRILVVDDQSRDRTREIASALAHKCGRIDLLCSTPLPPDWTGKSHACAMGAQAATASKWLCFLDADVRAEPEMIASAGAYADREDLDLLSLSPRQELKSFAERLIMPCGFYLLAFCQDLRRVQSRDSAVTTVTGQCMLVRRNAYDAVGGHAAVHGAICEDLALALLVKRLRGRVRLVDGRRLLSTRMYTTAAALWIGISKNLVDMLQGERRTLAIAVAAPILAWSTFLMPLFDAIGCAQNVPHACLAVWPGGLASIAALGLHVAGAAYFGIPLWYGPLFPIGYTVGSLIAFDSIRRRWTGTIQWKGRTYKRARS